MVEESRSGELDGGRKNDGKRMLGMLLVGLSAVAMGSLKSRGLTAWLWLVRTTGQAKANKKPLSSSPNPM